MIWLTAKYNYIVHKYYSTEYSRLVLGLEPVTYYSSYNILGLISTCILLNEFVWILAYHEQATCDESNKFTTKNMALQVHTGASNILNKVWVRNELILPDNTFFISQKFSMYYFSKHFISINTKGKKVIYRVLQCTILLFRHQVLFRFSVLLIVLSITRKYLFINDSNKIS